MVIYGFIQLNKPCADRVVVSYMVFIFHTTVQYSWEPRIIPIDSISSTMVKFVLFFHKSGWSYPHWEYIYIYIYYDKYMYT